MFILRQDCIYARLALNSLCSWGLVLNSWFSCLFFPSTGITDVPYLASFGALRGTRLVLHCLSHLLSKWEGNEAQQCWNVWFWISVVTRGGFNVNMPHVGITFIGSLPEELSLWLGQFGGDFTHQRVWRNEDHLLFAAELICPVPPPAAVSNSFNDCRTSLSKFSSWTKDQWFFKNLPCLRCQIGATEIACLVDRATTDWCLLMRDSYCGTTLRIK